MEREPLTLAAEEGREVPELGHVERLEDLTLVGSTITYNTVLASDFPTPFFVTERRAYRRG